MTHNLHDHARYTHDHRFLGRDHVRAELRAKLVTVLTALFMVVEILVGLWSGSMALLADGIHMATHAGALGLAALTYMLARRYDGDPRFSFGSGKFGDLTAFASAILMAFLALAVAVESCGRLIQPEQIAFGEALVVAAIGLLVNLVSAALLHEGHGAGHGHSHHHDHDHHHHHDHEGHDHGDGAQDNNLRAAYLHVLADALTSVLAICALAVGWYFGLARADALAGLVGAVLIASWAWGLLRDSARVLLDVEDDPLLAQEIRSWTEARFVARVCDFHLWRLGPGHRGVIVSLVGRDPIDADEVKRLLSERFPSLSHLTVETSVCSACVPPQ